MIHFLIKNLFLRVFIFSYFKLSKINSHIQLSFENKFRQVKATSFLEFAQVLATINCTKTMLTGDPER